MYTVRCVPEALLTRKRWWAPPVTKTHYFTHPRLLRTESCCSDCSAMRNRLPASKYACRAVKQRVQARSAPWGETHL
jgi:hypothetical protein